MKNNLIASVNIKGLDTMESKQKRDISNWLKKQAKDILMKPNPYSKTYKSRYFN